jgi:hypothetical protein
VHDAAGHADPRTTPRYDRARRNLDKHATYALRGWSHRDSNGDWGPDRGLEDGSVPSWPKTPSTYWLASTSWRCKG